MLCNVIAAVLLSRKSDQEITKSDFYQTIFLPEIRPKADPNLLVLSYKPDLFIKLNSNIKRSKSIFQKIFK